jgi:hypothetical protein
MKKDLQLPTGEELYALEQKARRERVRAIGDALFAGVKAVRSLVSSALRAVRARRTRAGLGHA